jgi:hypothetical protein
MKYSINYLLILFTACNNATKEEGLPGVYVTAYQNEFFSGDDTLLVSKANNGKAVYEIKRHTGLSKASDIKDTSIKIITEDWTLEYDDEKQTLFELKQGRILVWNNVAKTLQLGNRKYKKVE